MVFRCSILFMIFIYYAARDSSGKHEVRMVLYSAVSDR